MNPTLAIYNPTRCTPAKPTGMLELTSVGNVDVISMTDKEITNLCGKILSKMIHCLLVMLIKGLSFSINILYFLKIQSIHVPGIFRTKYDLLNMFDLMKLYAIQRMISWASTLFHKHCVGR